jgi:hypothetical protein
MVRVRNKSVKSLVAFAAILAAGAVAAPAFAQSLALPAAVTPTSYDASAGYTGTNTQGAGFGAITLRGAAYFGKYFGVEAEGAFGIINDNAVVDGVAGSAHINDQYAAYGVVRYPVTTSVNLFVRGGFGHTDIATTPAAAPVVTTGYDSWNYGAGGEYFFDGKNGVRVDYTRADFQDRGLKDADTVSVSYVHKF